MACFTDVAALHQFSPRGSCRRRTIRIPHSRRRQNHVPFIRCFLFGAIATRRFCSHVQIEARADSAPDTPTARRRTRRGEIASHRTAFRWTGTACCGHFYASAEAVFLASIGTQRFLTVAAGDATNNSAAHFGTGFDTGQGANEGLVATPRITLGYQGPCWGVDVRYWRMQNGKEVNDVLDENLIGLEQVSGFRAETVDLEATRLFCWASSQMQWAFGVPLTANSTRRPRWPL